MDILVRRRQKPFQRKCSCMWAQVNKNRDQYVVSCVEHRVILATVDFLGIDITELSGSIGSSETIDHRAVPGIRRDCPAYRELW